MDDLKRAIDLLEELRDALLRAMDTEEAQYLGVVMAIERLHLQAKLDRQATNIKKAEDTLTMGIGKGGGAADTLEK